MLLRKLIWALLLLLIALSSSSQAATYFVKNGGSDAADGLSDATAWANISKVNSTAFSAGDIIQFKRGSTWTGTTLIVDSIGASGNPVTYQSYDTGVAPIIQTAASHQTSGFTHAIDVTGDWNVVKDFLTRNAHESCIIVRSGGTNNTIQGNEATACGIGVLVAGSSNLITQNNVHDLEMIVNTAGGDDDYGATCFWFSGAANNNELSYNTGRNCVSSSFDYGTDGGFVEVFAGSSALSNLLIHHNYAENTNGFFETGGSGAGSASNIDIYYNVIYQILHGLCFHNGGGFGIAHSNFTFSNNTYYKTTGAGNRVFNCLVGSAAFLTVRNNIFYSHIGMTNLTGFTHTHNRYHMINGATVGYTLDATESSGDPLFVNAAAGNLHLQNTSPARDAGIALGYTLDFDNISVPQGSAPDMGAYEVSSVLSAPTNLHVVSP